MTTDSNQLYIRWGNRENAWFKGRQYKSQLDFQRNILKGSPEEVFISWPGQEQQVRNGLQDYIEKQIHLGDPLELRERELRHGGREVGRLSKDTVLKLQGMDRTVKLHVSNVIRYTCGRYFRERNSQYWDPLHESVKRQEWFYTVLVEEA